MTSWTIFILIYLYSRQSSVPLGFMAGSLDWTGTADAVLSIIITIHCRPKHHPAGLKARHSAAAGPKERDYCDLLAWRKEKM